MTVQDKPAASAAQISVQVSYRYCERLARREARNFYYSFVTLPPDRRAAMCAVYAFMRYTDDVSDGENVQVSREKDLGAWRAALDRALHGDYGGDPILPAFHDVVQRYRVPREYFSAVIDGVEMDLHPTCYETFDELRNYCYHVASVVGFICMHVWGYDSGGGKALEYGEACGVAFQLTNILRDLAEDARRDRVYLPQEDLRRFRVTGEDIKAGRMTENMRSLIRFEAERAAAFYEEANKLMPFIHPTGRSSLSIMIGIYRGILTQIERQNYDVFAKRARVSTPKKFAILLRAWVSKRS